MTDRPAATTGQADGGNFHSILFLDQRDLATVDDAPAPRCFPDLNLDQLVASILRGRDGYRLAAIFHTPLRDLDAIAYRHEVFADLAAEPVHAALAAFGEGMRSVRSALAQSSRERYRVPRQWWFAQAAARYRSTVTEAADALDNFPATSRALRGLRGHLGAYRNSAGFAALAHDVDDLLRALGEVRYTMHIHGDRVRVARYAEQPDYTTEVLEAFSRFRQGPVGDHRMNVRDTNGMNHVEAAITGLVAKLFPDTFARLADFPDRHADFLDPVLVDVDREAQFYLAVAGHVATLRDAGLPFCLPEVSADDKRLHVVDAFDMALADKLVADGRPVVGNDVDLDGPERILVVTGPNQGGKTTYARMVGQLHHLARLGCPVPGRVARLKLCDEVFTHFEREEHATDLHGKLEDDLLRIHDILRRATPDSLLIMNEIFTSTTARDALHLSTEVLRQVIDRDMVGVCVTFLDELSRLDAATVSMVGTVAPDDPSHRTYRLVRRPADGRSYALTLAERYGLTYQQLRERIGR
ncbi:MULTISPECIES: DNA mismatch repair protein MutS [Micromonospora]|uniref:DNA mismatch repair protein MutS n=1 Tax=Micromonospora solifontis TaxID=2487138 RepID=A0ABX9WED5_9ACTN|nr:MULTISPECIES: DNA mismatch repair protein MutS [Micromonospora]NES16998.1 DNA mismatch repair protein MutS [Micromonospora sp. PPF5-17B]NES38411.1 DNA mismatch repair protein MutS [Micromonospora solifontis]NES58721.1 DNA mismatch repair protein MutS [Micromonospora sp. PPF5-6]RNL95826.1 DNA mismatch repair protein MutS [Micromonospora solifontis]